MGEGKDSERRGHERTTVAEHEATPRAPTAKNTTLSRGDAKGTNGQKTQTLS
jgi:hypothetical protein